MSDPSSTYVKELWNSSVRIVKEMKVLWLLVMILTSVVSVLATPFIWKKTHTYYHQVQLKGVERLQLDTDLCNVNIPERESVFDAYILPEIIEPRLKPFYILW